ncbi:hypothetical protein FNH22_27235 [Fulvivirga sp. M361]|uniref:DUF6268 family outer membrane beta-barrel protein n=1 Tax=Fulvivirga sp. M361 TaxID=2594266 RepID=UPI00117AAD10|nr:DUF6268 family outer membrane beta-barrel protein [Fulvivirga sp. M361]TRX49323.1 hypothetical protein FNH22_27235 [Fulvivirga sp. M361]
MTFNLKYHVTVCLLSLVASKAMCQSSYRPKIAEFSYRSLYDYNTRSSSTELGNSSSEVEADEQLKIRLGIPLVLKDDKLVGLQFKYDVQNFTLDHSGVNNELFSSIEDRTFRSIGARFLFQQDLNDKKSLTFLGGAEIQSDRLVWNRNTTRFYFSSTYQVQRNARTQIGAGLVIGYEQGTPQIYPLLTYERKLSSKWTLDATLPKSVAFRYEASNRFFITAKTEVKGWRYALHDNRLSDSEVLTLRKADLNIGVCFEREIHDWLWAGFDIGLSRNLRYHLAEPGDGRRDALVLLNANEAPYVNFSLFIVPPRKFFK